MNRYDYGYGYRPARRGGRGLRLVIGLVIAAISFVSYLSTRSHNEITGEEQYVQLSPDQEIALGVASVPGILHQYGGDQVDARLSAYVSEVGARLIQRSSAGRSPYKFQFHVLNDAQTVNAFALPGGQVFVTTGLLRRLSNEAELAAVLGHEVGHVVGRHGAEHLAKAQLTQGLAAAYVVGADDPNDPYDTQRNAMVAAAVGQLVNLRYSRADELESDALGVRFAAESGYDPKGMVELLEVLQAASGGGRIPEFFSTHPNPENRIAKIQQALAAVKKGGERNEAAYRSRALSVMGVSAPAVKVPPRGEPLMKAAPRVPGMRVVPLSALPAQAKSTVSLIVRGGPFPYSRDGIEFQNREAALPDRIDGYYREYTVPTPGEQDRGARRLITGEGGELFYTDDHYRTFVQVDPES